MGPRVRLVLVVLLLITVAALAIPFAMSLSDRRTAALAAERDSQLSALADAAAGQDAPLQRLVDRYHEVYGEGLLVIDSDGRLLAGRALALADPGVAVAANLALVDAPASTWARILPWHSRPLLAAEGVRRDGELVGAVVVAVNPAAAARDVGSGWLWLAVGCLCFLLLAAVVARGLTRWVLRPVHGLERAVADMTEGISGPPAHVAGPPELRHFTSAFNTMAEVMRASLERQRRLVADASHQLRNPLAAVRLRADSLEGYVAEDGLPTYRAMSDELDRFENLLQQLMRLARAEQVSGSRQGGLADTTTESTDLGDVVGERIAFWWPVADRQDQTLRDLCAHPGPSVRVARHEIEQLLDVAIDNALRYAGPQTTVTVATPGPQSAGGLVDLVVSDDGRGLPAEDLANASSRFWRGADDPGGTGLGLAIAAEITAGHGGRIGVEQAPEGGLLIRYRLPRAGGPQC